MKCIEGLYIGGWRLFWLRHTKVLCLISYYDVSLKCSHWFVHCKAQHSKSSIRYAAYNSDVLLTIALSFFRIISLPGFDETFSKWLFGHELPIELFLTLSLENHTDAYVPSMFQVCSSKQRVKISKHNFYTSLKQYVYCFLITVVVIFKMLILHDRFSRSWGA